MSGISLLVVHAGMHGVAVYARDIATAVRGRDTTVRAVDVHDLEGEPDGVPAHAHFTDRLWGSSPEEAAGRFATLAAKRPVSVTLHDVPQSSDGPRNLSLRRAAYDVVARTARAVVVSSQHERELLQEHAVWTGAVTVIPLPVTLEEHAEPPAAPDESVGVLGYFYPGKGHDEVALAAVAAGARKMTVLGRASEGHAADLDAFVRHASTLGLDVEVTGWLEDTELARRGRTISVPVMAHQHVSASGSLASWIGWGRRPLAVRNRYVDEMARLRPGTVAVVDASNLASAIRDAQSDNDSTWHRMTQLPMSQKDAAERYLAFWEGLTH